MLRLRVAATVISIFVAACSTRATAQSLKLIGFDGATKTLGIAELQALPHVEVSDSGTSGKVLFRGPTVRSLVNLVGAAEGRALRGPNMMIVVIAELPNVGLQQCLESR